MNLTFRKLIAGSLLFSSLSFVAEENQKDFIELSYGEHEKQKIDFYPGGSKKVLVWIHGGGWVFGGKRASRWIERLERYYEVNEELNVFSIGYRYGEGTAPQAAEDALCAYKFIEQEIIERGLSQNDVIIMGLSSGAHLALLVGMKNSKGSDHKCQSQKYPAAIINFFGITEIEKNYQFLKDNNYFLNFVNWWLPPDADINTISKKYSPLYQVSENTPPIITIHGTDDDLVPYQQALLLKEKLGDRNELVSIEGGGHWRFSDEEHKDIKIKIDNFLEKNVQKN
jgi:acetyl esterase/lipase|tara:strand:- start:1171 stop:2019 length:849 start_codon:yes stop_codon:yes gene_type:complete